MQHASEGAEYGLNDLAGLTDGAKVSGNTSATFHRAASILDDCEGALSWIRSSLPHKEQVLSDSGASVIFCDPQLEPPESLLKTTCFIAVDNPKRQFARAVSQFFQPPRSAGIHPTALVHEEAVLGSNVSVGAFAVIEKVEIGHDCHIGAYSCIKHGSVLKDRVIIHEHVVIGSDGFGFVRGEDGRCEKFEHIGNTLLEEDVEIYPFCNVDRATLGTTRIKRGAKIDHYCHIGHNCEVGNDSLLTAGVVLCGGAQVGDRCWLAVNTIVKEKAKVGNDVIVGFGGVVMKDVPDGETWAGSPAEEIRALAGRRGFLKRLHQQATHQ